MHGDEDAGFHFDEGLHGFLGIHVHIPTAGGVVGTDGHQGDVRGVMFANFFETLKIRAVAAVENFTNTGVDHVAAVVAMGIVEVAGTPVVAGGVGDGEVIKLQGVPDGHFIDGMKAESCDQ